MQRKYTPYTLIKYLIKEFSISVIIFFLIFFSLVLLITYIEEIIFFKEKNISNFFYLKILLLSLVKSPSLIFQLSPFIFLFSGIFFFVKFMKNHEITPISLSGFSTNFITLVPAVYSFMIGIIIIIFLSPIASELSNYYEKIKQKYSNNDNLIIMSDTGIWIKERKNNHTFIIRADKIINQNFDELKNVSIYKFDYQNNFIEKIDGQVAYIKNDNWIIKNTLINKQNETKKIESYVYRSSINLKKLKNFFNNANSFSVWNIKEKINQLRDRGYYGQDIIISLHKYLSLPFFLFSMIFLSTIFTIKIKSNFNNFIYAFLGVLSGITIYFLSDLSIALGKSGKIPLTLSVWMPVIIIMTFSSYSLIRDHD